MSKLDLEELERAAALIVKHGNDNTSMCRIARVITELIAMAKHSESKCCANPDKRCDVVADQKRELEVSRLARAAVESECDRLRILAKEYSRAGGAYGECGDCAADGDEECKPGCSTYWAIHGRQDAACCQLCGAPPDRPHFHHCLHGGDIDAAKV